MVEQLHHFDRITREALTRILGCPLGERAWLQARLPVADGGLGLRAAANHAPAAYASSVLAAQPLSDRLLGHDFAGLNPDDPLLPQSLLDRLSAEQGELVQEEDVNGVSQKQLSWKIDQHLLKVLQEQIGEEEMREKARLLSLGLPHCGDWLNTPPLKALGLHLRPSEFVLATKYRLGLPLYEQEGPCPACRRLSDVLGDHAMSCGTGGERIARHNHLRDAIFALASAAGLAPIKEGRFLLPGDDRRPADVFIPYWAGGLDAALDVTVVNPLQDATLAGASTSPGHALTFAHDRKVRGAEEDCRRQGIAFLPLAVESFGGWHDSAQREVKKVAVALARHTGQEEAEACHHAWSRLGILLQRGNSAILANRVPSHPSPAVDDIV